MAILYLLVENFLKLVRLRNVSKKNKLLPTKIIFSPDEVFDAYVEFLEDQ